MYIFEKLIRNSLKKYLLWGFVWVVWIVVVDDKEEDWSVVVVVVVEELVGRVDVVFLVVLIVFWDVWLLCLNVWILKK